MSLKDAVDHQCEITGYIGWTLGDVAHYQLISSATKTFAFGYCARYSPSERLITASRLKELVEYSTFPILPCTVMKDDRGAVFIEIYYVDIKRKNRNLLDDLARDPFANQELNAMQQIVKFNLGKDYFIPPQRDPGPNCNSDDSVES